MQEQEWQRIRARMESTWPIPELPELRWAEYQREVVDLDEATVNLALDQLLTEGATVMPPPRLLRARARRGAPEFVYRADPEPPVWDDLSAATPAPASGTASDRPRADALPPVAGQATASLVLGIVGLVVVPLLCSVLAVVFGAVGLSRIRDNPGMRGRSSAMWGLWLGIVGLVAWAVLVAVLASTGGLEDESARQLLTL